MVAWVGERWFLIVLVDGYAGRALARLAGVGDGEEVEVVEDDLIETDLDQARFTLVGNSGLLLEGTRARFGDGGWWRERDREERSALAPAR